MNEKRVDISVVVPIFNSAICLEEHVLRTSKVMQQMNKSFEIILVDDGSKDASWETIKQLKVEHLCIVGIKLARNYGQQNATLCGISHTKGDWVITIDDDLEYPPETIPDLFQKQTEGNFDVVYGVYRRKKNRVRSFLAMSYKKYTTSISRKAYLTSSFRLIRYDVAQKAGLHANTFPLLDEYLSWYTDRFSSEKIICEKSKKGKSGYRFLDLYRVVKNEMLLNSEQQLRLIRMIGGAMSVVNFMLGLIIIYRKLILSIHVQGYTSLIVSILFSTGLIIYGLGIIAENISRIIKQSYGKPIWTEQKVI